MTERTAAEAIHPGEFLREELEARGWSQAYLASIVGSTESLVREVVSGKRPVSSSMAHALGTTLGTGGQFWINLEAAFQENKLSPIRSSSKDMAKKAEILAEAPTTRHPPRTELSASAKAERRPLPPGELVDALHDPVHRDVGRGRAARTVRNKRNTSDR